MLRYYMTPQTQQALIAESNRLIAHRARTTRSIGPKRVSDAGERADDGRLGAEAGADADADEASGEDSAFSRVVAELQSASRVARDH